MHSDGESRLLVGVGVLLLVLATMFAALRGWNYGAKATLAGVTGFSYLAVGLVGVYTADSNQLLRRAVLAIPLAFLGVFAGLQLADSLAYGSLSPVSPTALRALAATFLGYPVGFGYLYRSTPSGRRRAVVGTALVSVVAGSAVGSFVWVGIFPSTGVARFVLLLLVGLLVAGVGSGISYVLPSIAQEEDPATHAE